MKALSIGIPLSVLSGLLITLSFPTWNVAFLLFFALIPLFMALHNAQNFKQAFFFGWITGFTTLLSGEYWISFTMQEFGGFSKPLSFAVLFLYCLAFGLSTALFTALSYWIKNKSKISELVLLPIIYTSIEFLYPQLFPWYLGGSLYEKIAFIQFIDITGMSGLTFFIVLINILFLKIALYVAKPQKHLFPLKGALSAIALSLAIFLYGQWRILDVYRHSEKSRPISFSLIQTNIGNFEKSIEVQSNLSVIDQVQKRNFQMARAASESKRTDMIVLPETAVPGSLNVNDKTKYEMAAFAQELKTNLYFGGYAETGKHTFNTAYYLNAKGEVVGRYDKIYLLMFGEYMPLSNIFPFLKDLIKEVSDFTPGSEIQNFPLKTEFIGPLICYEDIIPSFVRRVVKNGATVLLNLANNSWFGESACPYQHLALSVFRSVENKVPLVRCTNTGISAFIDATGKIQNKSKLGSAEILSGEVKAPHIQTIYSKIGSMFAVICCVFLLFLIARGFQFKNRT
ncbi:MAG: apolipoprotein N-acyltransferase [Deltaproteobacteria bacterium]|nr:apolipoprotein N-acyltransferase [Deltaproteobacteria bacterium]